MKRLALFIAAAASPLAFSTAAVAQSSANGEYVVREGETLNGIANRAGVNRQAIITANGLTDPYIVRVGQRLKIPRTATAPTVAKKAATPAAVERTTAPSLAQKSSHIVQPGETLGGIANRARVPRILIAEANGLTPPYYVQPGRKLLIPRTRRYTVKTGDTGFDIAYRHAVSWEEIAIANGLDVNAPVKPGRELLIPTVLDAPAAQQSSALANTQTQRTAKTANAVAVAATATTAPSAAASTSRRFIWPVEGTIRRGWKARSEANHHDGIDIVAPSGRSVKASAGGTVIFAGVEPEQFGNLVVIDHGGGWNTAYGFLSNISVSNGARVSSGQQLGLVGSTGRAQGSELHFELRQGGVPIDPRGKLPKAP